MDFLAAQRRSRQKSIRLALGLALAVIGVIVSFYPFALWCSLGRSTGPFTSFWDGEVFFWTSLCVGGVIALGSLYKIHQISSGGGELIAAQMGGRLITRDTDDLAERRLLNVTEEMAIAAGIPAPLVFVLDEERGLNAFAAGLSTQDGVVGVTRGLLETLTRDELQGVVGHEISHIVNGDSRLNLKLIGVLYGIHVVAILGRSLTRARGRKAGAAILCGCLVYIVGSVGWLFGRLIQAAVSREREYLADASAAQFTRHPLGLASALNKLRRRGSRVRHPQVAAASHLFFGAVHSSPLFSFSPLATHPPLAERIARLGGVIEEAEEAGAPAPSGGLARARGLLADLPESLRQQARRPDGAAGLVGGLFLSGRGDIRARQEELLPPASRPAARQLHQWLSAQPEGGARYRLVWLDLALPGLREAPEAERGRLLGRLEELIRAGGRVSVEEFAFHSLLRGALRPPAERRAKLARLERLEGQISLLLAFIARAGSGGDAALAGASYQAAMACSPSRTRRPFPGNDDLSPDAVFQALDQLALAAPPYRQKILHACLAAARHDGRITAEENWLLRAYAQGLGLSAPL